MITGRLRSRFARSLLVGFSVIVGLWLVLPMLVVIPLSFTGTSSLEFPPPSWSTQWYRSFFDDPTWVRAFLNTLRIALLVTAFSILLGVPTALALTRSRFRGRTAVTALMTAPMIVPVVILAVAIYAVFLRWHLTGTTLGFLLAHSVLALPYVIVTVGAALRQYDPELDRAAASLGAGPWTTFMRVTLPIISPAVAAGALFAFAISLDEVVVSLFLVTPAMRTLPVEMFTSMTSEIDPTAAVASTFMLGIVTMALGAGLVFRLWRGRRQDG